MFEDLVPVWHFRMGLKGQTHQPGCIPPRSNLDPPIWGLQGTFWLDLPHLWLFGAVFGHKNGQKGQKFMGSTWISYFLNQTDKIEQCDEYIRIFEYIGHEYIFGHSFVSIFLLRIYSDIRSCQICLYKYIRTFVGECVIV